MSSLPLSFKSLYLKNHFNDDKNKRQDTPVVKTKIPSIDNNLSIRSGVILLGGLPSIGKSSMALQLADTFAEDGHKVLFISLEQSEYDLTCKSLNRIKSQHNLSDEEAIKHYMTYAKNIATVASLTTTTVEAVTSTVHDYVTANGKTIVFIDYLQLLQTRQALSKRELIEEVSRQLVHMARRLDITVFVLSSLNRANYMSPIDFESFKESGSLEYDADVVLGMQYQILKEISFINTASIDKKRIMLTNEKTNPTRRIELVCLKNRYGSVFEKCKLLYHPEKDIFEDGAATESMQKSKTTKIL